MLKVQAAYLWAWPAQLINDHPGFAFAEAKVTVAIKFAVPVFTALANLKELDLRRRLAVEKLQQLSLGRGLQVLTVLFLIVGREVIQPLRIAGQASDQVWGDGEGGCHRVSVGGSELTSKTGNKESAIARLAVAAAEYLHAEKRWQRGLQCFQST